jgi:hypothetical protein
MSMNIDRYITSVRTRAGSALDDDAAEELRAHLEDAANDLQLRGLDPAASRDEALRRFGQPEDIGAAFVRARRVKRLGFYGPRSLVAALVVALSLAVLGGSAVAATHAPPKTMRQGTRHYNLHYAHDLPAQSVTGAALENH